MSGKQKDLDANEPATQYKLDKAHEKGSVARSAEVTFAVVLLVCVACVYGLGAQVIGNVALMARRALSFVDRSDLTPSATLAYVHGLTAESMLALAPAMFAVWIAALFAAALQVRGVFSAHPLKPDFTRLNPANGFKRLFAVKSLHELWRSGAKLAVVTVAMTVWGRHHASELLHLSTQNPWSAMQTGLSLLGSALAVLTGIIVVFAILDYGFNRWDFLRQMRMSKREIKDEHKERDGDPRIKARLRELRMKWLQRTRELAKVRTADVLLTNPTHYAIALEYRHGEMPAPMITARGAGDMAQRMKVAARRHSIPVVEQPALARALFALHESQTYVPEEHFEQVARVLRWVYAARSPVGLRGAQA